MLQFVYYLNFNLESFNILYGLIPSSRIINIILQNLIILIQLKELCILLLKLIVIPKNLQSLTITIKYQKFCSGGRESVVPETSLRKNAFKMK